MYKQNSNLLNRVLSVLLCLALLLPYVPVLVQAAENAQNTPVYLLAGSDFQGEYVDNQHVTEQIESNITSIMSAAGRKDYEAFLFLGDYNLGGDDNTVKGLSALKNTIKDYSFTEQYYLQGNHDAAPDGSNGLTASGGHTSTYYDVYALNWEVYGEKTSKADVQALANQLDSWLASRTVGDKPIFVISHMPLHYSLRTASKGDAQYAKYLVDVLNAAGQRGLNIIFMFGHNHSSGYDRYMGGSTNFVGKGESIWIADLEGTDLKPNERTLNFTYMNAGYIGSIGDGDSSIDHANTMSVFEINGDDVTIRRYDASGEHALQATAGKWWDDQDVGYQLDTRPQASGVTVAGSSIELVVPEKISTNNFAAGTFATISVKNGGNAEFSWDIDPVSGSDVAAITSVDNATDSATIDAWYPGTVRVTATNNATGESASVYIQIVNIAEELIVESTNQVFWRLVDRFTEGKRYLLVNMGPNGSTGDNTGKANAVAAFGSGTALNTAQTVLVGSYRAGMPFVMYSADGNGGEADRPVWWYEGGSLRNASRKTSYLAISDTGAPGLLKPTEHATMSSTWYLDDGLCSNVGSTYYRLMYQDLTSRGEGVSWITQNGVDNRYHTKVYAYEETPLYAIGEVSDRVGQVAQNAASATETDSYIVKTWSNGRVEYIPVTMDMLSSGGAAINTSTARTIKNVTVTYNGVALCDDYTLTVGNLKTITVNPYSYYRLTDGLKYEYNDNFYLIVNRNTLGDGFLMATYEHNSSVNAEKVNVTLDANGIPCIRLGGVNLTYSNNTAFALQEWRVRDTYRVYQPNAYGSGFSTYLTVTSNDSGGELHGRDNNYTINGDGMTFFAASTVMEPTENGYQTVFGKTASGIAMYIQYSEESYNAATETYIPGTFITVRDYDRCLGSEVYAYEKVTSNTAVVSLLSQDTYMNKGTANVGTQSTGSRILITREDGTVETVPVTLNMITGGSYNLNTVGKYKNLTVTYQGVVLTNSFTMNVIDPDNPVYPQPGSVKADKVKDTSEYDFDETGVARVDLSAAGVSSAQKLDVLVIVDTSSSVVKNFMDNGETRLQAMRRSIDTLIDDLAQPTADGSLPDIQLAITQFNDYNYFGNVNSLVGHEPAADGGHPGSANQTIQYYTDIFEMQDFDSARIQAYSCTNYDIAFRHAYHIVKGRIEANGSNKRDQVVIFMTDGICYQYNYISNKFTVDQAAAMDHSDNYWKQWMMGTLDEAGLDNTSVIPSAALDWYHPEGKNWMAEAIKGSPDRTYKVIDKTDSAYDVGGTYDKNTNLQYVQGLGATMYTIGFGLTVDGDESVEVGRHILTQAASDPSMYYSAENAEELYSAFQGIGLSVRTAASQAVLMDTMGANFDLQMGVVKDSNGIVQPLRPTITVKGYDLYKVSEVGTIINGKTVTEDMVGKRKHSYPDAILEVVTFNDDGTEAYSNRLSGNIMQNGIINAMYFQYNTNKYTPDAMGQPMPGYEQFLWNVGTVREQELVLSYYVYLENAMGEDGKGVADGNYNTNEYAALQYVDVNGEEKSIELDSPNLNWVNTTYSVGYYLVDRYGNPINTSGSITDFAGKYVVGGETVNTIHLNTENSTDALVVPEGYTLFDASASATIKVHSGVAQDEKDIALDGDYSDLTWTEGGEWTITSSTEKKTTYVEGYGGLPTTNTSNNSNVGNYSDIKFWFAVVVELEPVLEVDKYVTATDVPDEFILTLEAYSLNGVLVVNSTGGTTETVDETAVLKEILSDYFQLKPENSSAVKVYTAAFTGINANGEPTFSSQRTSFAATVTVTSTDPGRLDTVLVSGFAYDDEYCAVEQGVARGKKLIVEVSVKARDGFWGGNNVPTNDPNTAIYTKKGANVTNFPMPEVNVPLNLDITVQDQVVYYGEDQIGADDLFQKVTVDGVEVPYNTSTGKFEAPTAMPWADDYASIDWAQGSSNLNTPVSGVHPNDYVFSVNIKPKYDGSTNLSDNPSNLAGPAVSKDGITDSDTASVDVLVPVLTFKDSTIKLGDETTKAYYESTNRTGEVVWVNINDPYGNYPVEYPTKPTAGFDTAPVLNLTYTPEGTGENYFRNDTPVEVTVFADGHDITWVTIFLWENCGSELHDEATISAHYGRITSPEFYIHVIYSMEEDKVVIDYGIPVDIHPLRNDRIPEGATIVAIMKGSTIPGSIDAFKDAGNKLTTLVNSTFGSLLITGDDTVRYTLSGMQMTSSECFVYAAEYNGKYYFSKVYVIPATMIYYEDNFVKLDILDSSNDVIEGAKWDTESTTNNTVQDEDRPGEDKNDALGSLDMDSIYGYDSHYTSMNTYSLGHSAAVKVKTGRAGRASFSFWGTGFDVISLSSCDTGTIVVKVTDADGNYIVNYLVDTYYGYKFDGENWIVDTQAKDNALYQVPVIKVDLNSVAKTKDADGNPTSYWGYGQYKVEIIASYAPLFDHQKDDSYDFYLDAIRIYDPANDGVDDTVIKNAYIEDGEYMPTYDELRNLLIGVEEFNSLGDKETAGAIFIDGNGGLTADGGNGGSEALPGITKPGVTEYANYGPNNELYLAYNQAVAFKLNSVNNLNQVHLALKSVGGAAKVTIYGVDDKGVITSILEKADINTATDLYYNITKLINQTVVIRNSGESGMLSITNIKSTYLAAGTNGQMLMSVDTTSANAALASLEGEKDPIVSEGIIAPESATLTYEDEILLNIYFTMEGIDPSELGLMTYTADGSTVLDTIPGASYVDGKYVVTTKPIAPKNLGDTVYFRVYAKLADGSYVYSNLLSYSPKTYAMNILNKSEDVAMKALVVAMLNYGAEAQKYFGYKTEALVNADLNAEQKALVADYSADMIAPLGKVDSAKVGAFVANGGFGKKYPTVSLEGAFAINYYFENSYAMNNGMTLYYWTAEDYANAEVLTAENATGIVNGTTVSSIAAKDLNSTIYVAAVYESNGTSYCTGVLPYSIGAFCVSNGSALAQAIAVYGSYAKAYFG